MSVGYWGDGTPIESDPDDDGVSLAADLDGDDGAGLDDDLDLPADTPSGIFADNYPKLRALGWSGVLWLPEGEKKPPLGVNEAPLRRSLTGYAGEDCDASELHLLASSTLRKGRTGRGRGYSGARGNIAVRAERNVIVDGIAYDLAFLDLDDYAKGDQGKTGAKTVADIETRVGVRFPATFKITSRGEGVSGKYPYLIPAGTSLVRECKPDVEIVQWFHRYAVVPPSTNRDSNGTTAQVYSGAAPRRGECAGQLHDGMFRPEQATVLPSELVAALVDDRAQQSGSPASDPEVRAFLDALAVDPDDPTAMCKATSNSLARSLDALNSGGGTRYSTALAGMLRLLRCGHNGHIGVPAALEQLGEAYVRTQRAPGDTVTKAQAEVQRMIYNPRGIGLILSNPTPEEERGCRCGVIINDEQLAEIIENGDEGMGVSLDEVRDAVGAERYDAMVARVAPHPDGGAVQRVAAPPVQAMAVASPPTNGGAPMARTNGAAPVARPAPSQVTRPDCSLLHETQHEGDMPALFGEDTFSNDDVGNGRRFVAVWGNNVAWVPDEKRTYIWTGQRWEYNTGAQMRDLAERLTDFMLNQAKLRLRPAEQRYENVRQRANDDPAKVAAGKALAIAEADLKWARSSRSEKLLKACINGASANPSLTVRSGEWDADDRLLNVGNGTLRLELDGSHTFCSHCREHRLTQQAAVHYDPDATAPQFLAALERWLPDPEVRRLVRAIVGISLLGNNSRHKFPVFIGKERAGKTTLAEVVAAMLDNPAVPAVAYSGSFELNDLRPKQGKGPNPSLYRVVRRRWVYCSEADDGGKPLSADLMKRFSGGDRQAARDTYGKADSINDKTPAFTPVLATNKTPEVEGADAALKERIIAIWFGHTLPRLERDPDFPEKLQAEHSGMLNWALEGYRDAIEHPEILTDLPQECVDKAALLFQGMTIYERWKADETVPSDDVAEWIANAEAWPQFVHWCAEQREDAKTQWKFGHALGEMGHPAEMARRPRAEGQDIGESKAVRLRVGLAWSEAHHERLRLAKARYKAERDALDSTYDDGMGGEFADHG